MRSNSTYFVEFNRKQHIMKREFSQRVQILILPTTTNLFKDILSSSEIIFDETIKQSPQGILYEQSLQVIIDQREIETLKPKIPYFKAIVKLDDGINIYTWGDKHLPVKITILPKIEKCSLDMSRVSTLPLINR